jgi:dephospho-CoA kinase
VSRLFQEQGAAVIDADRITHDIYDLHPSLSEELIQKFGEEIRNPTTKLLDRRRLGALVFGDSKKRKELEALLHPHIGAEIAKQIEKAREEGAALALVDAALLVETGFYKAFEGLIVVKADREQQIVRIMARDALSQDEISQRIAAQMPLAEKLKVADWVIDNSGEIMETKRQVEELYKVLTHPS